MAKENKYKQYAKARRKLNNDVDIYNLAVEYKKLLSKRFKYVFQGNVTIEFQFKMENFFHLLGFHKLSDVSAVKMVNHNKMSKEKFFKYILEGKITFSNTDSDIVDDKEIVNICDTKKKSAFGEVKAHRFELFSESNILELLLNDPVIDYDDNQNDSLIEADKIFFKMNSIKKRNLNLFIGYDEKKKQHYTSTFFLEMKPNTFLNKKGGHPQELLYILSRTIHNTETNELEEFVIKWENIRKEFADNELYKSQVQLKKWINDSHIAFTKANVVLNELKIVKNKYEEEIEIINKKIEIANLVQGLSDEKCDDEEVALQLMKYDIDAELDNEIAPYIEMDLQELNQSLNKIEEKMKVVARKIKRFVKFLPGLRMLEIEEVKIAYRPYMDTQKMSDEIISKIIDEYELFEKTIIPSNFIKIYDAVEEQAY